MDENTYVEPEINEYGTNKKAITGFVCAIVGLTCCFPVGIVGFVFCIIALNEIKQKGTEQGRGLAIAGIIIAALGLVTLGLYISLGLASFFMTPYMF